MAATDLYHVAIIEAARRASGAGHLDAPDTSVTLDNPLCGDRVSVDIRMGDGRISAYAQRVKGCLLCEAAASIIGEHAVGQRPEQLAEVTRAVEALLENPAGENPLPWPKLAVFTPVGSYRSRHRCVLLAFEALAEAVARSHRDSVNGLPGAR